MSVCVTDGHRFDCQLVVLMDAGLIVMCVVDRYGLHDTPVLRDGTPLRDEHHRQPGNEPDSAPPPPALPGILHVVLLPAGNGDPIPARHGRRKGQGNVSNSRLLLLLAFLSLKREW